MTTLCGGRAFRNILQPLFRVIDEAGDGGDGLEKALACRPDVVLMDIRMPGMDGIAAAQQIRQALPEASVVMMTASSDDAHLDNSIRVGASGYLLKDHAPHVIIEAIARVAQGGAYLPPAVATRVLQAVRLRDSASTSPLRLTDRERSVLKLVAEGYRHKEIGRELGISTRTVNNHVASIYNKLGISDRGQAIVYAIKKGILKV